MRQDQLKNLFEKQLLSEEQHNYLQSIESRKVFSVYYELRTILYLGILLFTGGAGLLLYENIGELGHLLSIGFLILLTVACFVLAFKQTLPYTNDSIKSPTPYFDYVVLLGCLLFVSVLGYLQFQFSAFTESLGLSTLISALIFFAAAYRFDNVAVLSLAITAFASFWSISISPVKWYSGDFFEQANLHNTALFFSGGLMIAAMMLDYFSIKKHFTFSYLNFGLLIFFAAALTGLFMEELTFVYATLIYLGAGFAVFVANQKRTFVFLLYAFLAAYIVTTYLVGDILIDSELWFFYLMASCGGFVFFIIRYRNYFKREI